MQYYPSDAPHALTTHSLCTHSCCCISVVLCSFFPTQALSTKGTVKPVFPNIVAGSQIVVEEFLIGEEASFFALLDGNTCLALASAQV